MSKEINSNAIESIITKAMLQIGFSPAYNGFYFLRDAVKISYFDETALSLITKLIYLPLSKDYKTTSENIEKSIRKSADIVWSKNTNHTINILNSTFTFPERRPENKQLIFLICTLVKQTVNIFDADICKGI